MAAGERKACTVLHGREDRSFHVRLSLNVTKGLSDDGCVEETVVFPSAGSLRTPHTDPAGPVPGAAPRVQGAGAHRPAGPERAAAVRETIESTGGCLIARRDDVEGDCVVDGQFTALCNVVITAAKTAAPLLPTTTSSRLDRDILLASDLTDVSFLVDGETFRAHRLVLAARSPVFKASLFGSMAESTASSITIEDMRGSMLHYMYHGALPAAVLLESAGGADRKMEEVEHLLVGADRYGVDTLKRMCEEILCAGVSTSTVLSTWVFAEERACLRLNTKCLEFLNVGDNFKQVAITDQYVDLMKNVPSFGAQVRNLFKRPKHNFHWAT
ncbi:hypothetical protein QOZ80_6BG0486180 [Eleusine coracana subsp. coracana]|nr:hypothetical protein QOZ80_6BG0486180 [Eleusine coracana subsp. coracana]